MKRFGMNQQSVFDKYATARGNLLLMLAFTVVNIVLLVMGSDSMFLFSASVPYNAMIFGIIDETGFLMIPAIVITVVTLAAYLLCWIFSKKHFGWMIAALVLFALDIVAMVGLWVLAPELFDVVDLLIHGWVLYYLIVGVISGAKIRSLPEGEVPQEEQPVEDEAVVAETEGE